MTIAKRAARLSGPHFRYSSIFVGVLLVAFCMIFYWKMDAADKIKPHRLGDLMAIWSYGKLGLSVTASELYDMARLHATQVTLGMADEIEAPFSYPPTALPVFALLGLFDFNNAAAIWTILGMAAYLAAVIVGSHDKAVWAALAVIAPSTAVCLFYGQTGFVLAALLVGGLRLLDRRPILAGIAFGLMTFKPQLAALLPVLLIARGDWRAFRAAGVTSILLAATAVFGWGWQAWPEWLGSLARYREWYEAVALPASQPSLLANLALLGIPRPAALVAGAVVALAAIALVWHAGRKLDTVSAGLVLVTASFLAVPHTRVYELPVLTAMLLAYAASRQAAGRELRLPVIAAGLFLPAGMMAQTPIPLSAPIFVAILVMVWRDATAENRQNGSNDRGRGADVLTAPDVRSKDQAPPPMQVAAVAGVHTSRPV